MAADSSYFLSVQGKRFQVAAPSLTGMEIRALIGAAAEWTLVLERAGDKSDIVVKDEDVVSLEDQPILFLTPPAVFG